MQTDSQYFYNFRDAKVAGKKLFYCFKILGSIKILNIYKTDFAKSINAQTSNKNTKNCTMSMQKYLVRAYNNGKCVPLGKNE